MYLLFWNSLFCVLCMPPLCVSLVQAVLPWWVSGYKSNPFPPLVDIESIPYKFFMQASLLAIVSNGADSYDYAVLCPLGFANTICFFTNSGATITWKGYILSLSLSTNTLPLFLMFMISLLCITGSQWTPALFSSCTAKKAQTLWGSNGRNPFERIEKSCFCLEILTHLYVS